MRLTTSVLAVLAALTLTACKSDEEQAREILAAALQDYAVMQDQAAPTQDRLTAGQSVSAALDRIVAEFGTTDLGLEIAAGGTVGQITTTDLRQQISALQDLRAFERCDQEPTPVCVVDRLAAALGFDDRAQLFERVEPDASLLMAMAIGDTATSAAVEDDVRDEALKAFILAMSPEGSLDPRLVTGMFEDLREDSQDMAAGMAAYRVVSGNGNDTLRDIASRTATGQSLLQVFDKDATVADRFAELDGLEDQDRLNGSALQDAGNILSAFGQLENEELWLGFAMQKHPMDEIIAFMSEEQDGDIDYFQNVFGAEAANTYAKRVIADPGSDARALSLALMSAASLMPEADLRQTVADLDGREVMTWDNIRLFDPLVALGYLGDRALFDSVLEKLTTPENRASLEPAWDTGVQLAQGTVADAAMQDDRLFRSAVRVGSLRGTADQMQAFLGDAATKVADVAEDFGGPTSRVDVVSAARDCGMLLVLQQMGATYDDFDRNFGSCDETRLGKGIADLSDAEFAVYLSYAQDIFDVDGLEPLRAAARTAPARAFALVQQIEDREQRVFLTAYLAMALAQG